ncbi:MAG: hypothetical protein EBQ65_03095 [Chitinophagaceae bacterium]|nr:hypothetical protein [Chitinophagaceae bacterium]
MRLTALKLTASILLVCGLTANVSAQTDPINVVTTAVPFLRISPDARSGGMGEMGVATSPDSYSGIWNIAKVAFNQSNARISATYTPWMKDLVNDVYLASVTGFKKLDDNQALSASVRYFSLGNIQFTDFTGAALGTEHRPREFGVDLGYSRKLSDKSGVGITLKYINSNLTGGLTNGSTTYKTGSSVAADLGYYHDGKKNGTGLAWGAVLSNLGAKISYTNNADAKDFIPANLGLGLNYTKKYNNTNTLSFGAELNKLLVPTPPGAGATAADLAAYRSKSVVGSWFSSLGDAPGGFGEEMKEVSVGAGAEWAYNSQFYFRAGYFYENKTKGDRRYFTTGLGVKYNVFHFNFAYLIPSGSGVNRNPLSNTLRFQVSFDLGGK